MGQGIIESLQADVQAHAKRLHELEARQGNDRVDIDSLWSHPHRSTLEYRMETAKARLMEIQADFLNYSAQTLIKLALEALDGDFSNQPDREES